MIRTIRTATFVAAGVGLAMLVGCESMFGGGKDESARQDQAAGGGGGMYSSAPANATLYQRLGRQEGIRRVVDRFTDIAAKDPQVNFTRNGQWQATPENVNRFKERMTQWVAVVSGARDVRYEGSEMVQAHRGMGINDAEFDASIRALKRAMVELNVPLREQAELVALVNGQRATIAMPAQGQQQQQQAPANRAR